MPRVDTYLSPTTIEDFGQNIFRQWPSSLCYRLWLPTACAKLHSSFFGLVEHRVGFGGWNRGTHQPHTSRTGPIDAFRSAILNTASIGWPFGGENLNSSVSRSTSDLTKRIVWPPLQGPIPPLLAAAYHVPETGFSLSMRQNTGTVPET
jgi:hypothetical protein